MSELRDIDLETGEIIEGEFAASDAGETTLVPRWEERLNAQMSADGMQTAETENLLAEFADFFDAARTWEAMAKTIVVTDAGQRREVRMAREGRLFLKAKRVALETRRKELKAEYLRKGRAVDGVANILKSVIVPIEEYLESQEKFAEIQEAAAKAEADRIAAEIAEAERLRKLAEEAEEQARIRAENERLKAEAEAQAAVLAAERAEAERKEREAADALAAEKRAAEEREAAIRREAEAKAADERKAAAEKEAAAQREIAEANRKAAEARMQAEREKREAAEREAALLAATVTCPNCGHRFVPESDAERQVSDEQHD
jgi:hypothetical protein